MVPTFSMVLLVGGLWPGLAGCGITGISLLSLPLHCNILYVAPGSGLTMSVVCCYVGAHITEHVEPRSQGALSGDQILSLISVSSALSVYSHICTFTF